MDMKESKKIKVSGDCFENAGNCSVQAKDEENSFECVHIPPLVPVIMQFQDEQILFDGQMIHKKEDKNSDFEKENSFNSTNDDQTSLSVMSSHNEADNTNDPLCFYNDAPLSVDKPYDDNVQNPGICILNVKEEIIEAGSEMSWPKETSRCSETPCFRSSKDNISLVNDTMQPESKVIEHDGDGVVFKIQGVPVTVDQSVNAFDESSKFNQLASTIDQTQSGSCCKCEKCDRIFADEETFRRHMKVKHPDRSVVKRHKCEFCCYSSNISSCLKNHLRVHTKEKPFQCTVCLKWFTQESNLKKHIRIHTKERPYECNKCGKKFTQLSSMRTHIRTVHEKSKPFVCNICSYTCGLATHLESHMSTHTGVRNYKCQYCDKKFTHSSAMRRHERIHAGEKPQKCQECSASFTRSSELHKHVIIHHTESLRYPYS